MPPRDWVYSVKFAGCRLNDVMNMIPRATYEAGGGTGALYDTVCVADLLVAADQRLRTWTLPHFGQI